MNVIFKISVVVDKVVGQILFFQDATFWNGIAHFML
jgi:hypothetical protein